MKKLFILMMLISSEGWAGIMKCETVREGTFVEIVRCQDSVGTCYLFNGHLSCVPTNSKTK